MALEDHVFCGQHARIGRAEWRVQAFFQVGSGYLWTNGSQPASVYHYTSVDSIQSIIESKCLWLSRSDHMNDQVEVTYGLGVLLQLLSERSGSRISELMEFVEVLRNHPLQVFVFSSAFGEDSLAHWNAFSNNDGVCIEFSLARLSTLLNHAHQTAQISQGAYRPIFYQDLFQQRLGRVLYDAEIQNQYANKAIDACLGALGDESVPIGVRWFTVREIFLTITLFFKAPEFYAETEYRLCLIGKEDHPDYTEVILKRDANWTDSLPFVALPLNFRNGTPITSIMSHPLLEDWEDQKSRIMKVLSSLGLSEESVQFETSKIKLRF
jgi:hypothetical protein